MNSPDKILLKKRFLDYLIRYKITQKQFAKHIHKSEVTVSRWLSPQGRGFNGVNTKLIEVFLALHDPPEPEFINKILHLTKKKSNTASSFESEIEDFRHFIIFNIIKMSENASKDQILKMISVLPWNKKK